MKINNNIIYFKSNSSNDDYFADIERIYKKRDKTIRKNIQSSQIKERELKRDTYTAKKNKKLNKINIPVLTMAALSALGIFTTAAIKDSNTDKKETTSIIETIPEQTQEFQAEQVIIPPEQEIAIEEIPPKEVEAIIIEEDDELKAQEEALKKEQAIKEAVETIKNDAELKKLYYEMTITIQRMKNVMDDPVGKLQELLSQEWVDGVDIELILPQIFYESSGNHYNENGTVLTSTSNCVGYMQLSQVAQTAVNDVYFTDNPQDRFDPIGNLNLGIGLIQLHLDNYFEGDLFNSICAYNAGAGNIMNGNYLGSNYYADKILKCRENLKNHQDYTQMLLDGDLDPYLNDFLS